MFEPKIILVQTQLALFCVLESVRTVQRNTEERETQICIIESEPIRKGYIT